MEKGNHSRELNTVTDSESQRKSQQAQNFFVTVMTSDALV